MQQGPVSRCCAFSCSLYPGLGTWLFISCPVSLSLIPRLLRSGTQTLKLCRRREPGIFPHVSTTKCRKILIAHGHTRRLRTEKRAKVAGNLLHVSSYRGVNIIHTERWTHSWLSNAQNVAFLFLKTLVLFWLRHGSREKSYQALHACTFHIPGSLGTRLVNLTLVG